MPELDGFELAAMIRQHPRFQRTAIIFISAVHLTDLDRSKATSAERSITFPFRWFRASAGQGQRVRRVASQDAAIGNPESRLEQRVWSAPKSWPARRNCCCSSTRNCSARIRNSTPSSALLLTLFSAARAMAATSTSATDFTNTPEPPRPPASVRWFDFVHPDDVRAKQSRVVRRAFKSANGFEAEYRLRSKDGDYRWFRSRAVPIRDPHGRIVKWYGTCSDIHDSKLLEQSIRDNAAELEKMVDRRTGRIASPFRPPYGHCRIRSAAVSLAISTMAWDRNSRWPRWCWIKSLQKSSPKMNWTQASSIVERAIQQVRTMFSPLCIRRCSMRSGLLSAFAGRGRSNET